jgi:hypothetical protein
VSPLAFGNFRLKVFRPEVCRDCVVDWTKRRNVASITMIPDVGHSVQFTIVCVNSYLRVALRLYQSDLTWWQQLFHRSWTVYARLRLRLEAYCNYLLTTSTQIYARFSDVWYCRLRHLSYKFLQYLRTQEQPRPRRDGDVGALHYLLP